uniref:Sperm-associated antigen 6 n=1 Tax=Cacopsylla melanoneura TaxID=428564 RepID=A0A8D9FJT7_9HEMI
MACLNDLDSDTKASTALTLGHMMESRDMADHLVGLGVLPELIQTLSNPDLNVKQAAAFALDAIVKHDPVLAQDAVRCNVIPLLIKAVNNDNDNVKQTALH